MIGFSYALWSETLYITGTVNTSELDWEFVMNSHTQKDPPGTNDWNSEDPQTIWQVDKDVGCTTITFEDSDQDGDYDTLLIIYDNIYPLYYEHIAFKVHNNGDIPLKIWKIIINGIEYFANVHTTLDLNEDGVPDVQIWYGDNFGLQMHPCENANLSFDFVLLQGAPQGQSLGFTIEIVAVQYNEYQVP